MPSLNYSNTGNGKPLLVLHGLFGSGKNWQSQARLFANEFEVFTIDLRNHGQSFHADEMSYAAMAADLDHLITQLDLAPCYLLGHSMGGKVGMMLAARRPELLKAMIVADIAPVSYFHHYDDLINPIRALRLSEIKSRAEADLLLRANIPEDQLRTFLLQNLVRSADGWQWRINWSVIQRDMENLTGFDDPATNWSVDMPTLFIRGANSDYIGEQEIDMIRQRFTHSQVETIEAAGHWLHVEQPEIFTRKVLDFLRAN